MGHIPGPSLLASGGPASWGWGGVNKARGGLSLALLFSWLPTQQTFDRGNQPSFLPPNPDPGEGAHWLFTWLTMEVLGPRPLSLLEESEAQASAPPGMGTQEIQGPTWGGV